jgi:hypothetical protein
MLQMKYLKAGEFSGNLIWGIVNWIFNQDSEWMFVLLASSAMQGKIRECDFPKKRKFYSRIFVQQD